MIKGFETLKQEAAVKIAAALLAKHLDPVQVREATDDVDRYDDQNLRATARRRQNLAKKDVETINRTAILAAHDLATQLTKGVL